MYDQETTIYRNCQKPTFDQRHPGKPIAITWMNSFNSYGKDVLIIQTPYYSNVPWRKNLIANDHQCERSSFQKKADKQVLRNHYSKLGRRMRFCTHYIIDNLHVSEEFIRVNSQEAF